MPARTPQPTAEVRPLTGLRGLLAWWVVWFHFGRDVTPSGWLRDVAATGHVAVDVFFVLSGYVLALRYGEGPMATGSERRAFWIKRIARVYPLYLVSLGLGYAARWPRSVSPLSTGAGLGRLVLQLLVMNAWWHPVMFAINWAAWSLSVEIFFYALFPFVFPPIRRLKARALFVLIAWSWASTFIAPAAYSLLDPDGLGRPLTVDDNALWCWYLKFFPLQRLPEFVAGVALARLATEYPATLRAIPRFSPALAGILLIAAGTSHVIPFAYLHSGVLLPLALLLMAGLTASHAHPLGARVLVALGRASYATYILHVPFFFLVGRFHTEMWNNPAAIAEYGALLLMVSLASFRFVEEPLRKRIAVLASRSPSR